MKRSLMLLVFVLVACDAPKESPAADTATTTAAAKPPPKKPEEPKGPPLLTPKQQKLEAPAKYEAEFDTTKGKFVIEVDRSWAPRGADRFYNLVKIGFYSDVAFFRVVNNFVVQWGLHGDPKVSAAWKEAYIADEMVKESNTQWTITYAKSAGDTRTTQVFINLKDNSADLDGQGFSPFGKVTDGKKVVESLYSEYGEYVQMGGGPKKILAEGNTWLKKKYPKLDYIKSASILE